MYTSCVTLEYLNVSISMYVYKPCDSRVSQCKYLYIRIQSIRTYKYLNARNVRMHVYDSCLSVSSIWIFAMHESRMHVCIHVVFECLKHLNACNVRMHVYDSCSSVSSIWMFATFECTKVECTKVEYTKVECTKVECMKVECTYIYKLRDSRVFQAFECNVKSNTRKSNICMYTNRVILECLKHSNIRNIRIYESQMYVCIQAAWFSSVLSIWMLATFECTKVECTKVVCIQRVILKYLKHSNVRNIRIYESRMHIYIQVMWFSSVFECSQCTKVRGSITRFTGKGYVSPLSR